MNTLDEPPCCADAETRRLACVAEVARARRELDDFAYVASHDLREPLRGIATYARFLQEDYGDRLDDEGRRMLEALPRLTGRMEALVESLLQYSRVGRAELARVEVALDVVVDRVADTLAPLLAERGVEVHVRRPLPVVVCDPVLTEQVFASLVSNAATYNDRPPGDERWVEVGARHNEGPPVLYVRDNGIGIPERHHRTIFRIFKRLHAQDRYGGGAGAGLTIVQKIVERHGGRIWLESAPGEGSTFFFTLGGSP